MQSEQGEPVYSYNKQVREVLKAHPDGLTCAQINKIVKAPEGRILAVVKSMPDAYIDRWQTQGDKKYLSAVWCVVVPPENCPKPEQKPSTKRANSVKKGV